MIKKFLSQNLDYVYYLIRSIDKKKKFLIIFPNFISIILKKTLVFDKKKKSFFFIFIDSIFDYDSILEIFGQECYNLINHRLFDELVEKYKFDKSKAKVIIDCGANIGCSALYFNKIVDGAKIICIEPDNKNYKLLKKNLRYSNFELINSAVANSITTYSIIDNKNKRAIKVQETKESNKTTITPDSIIQNYKKDNHINFIIKIDIEGFEKNLFEKNYSWLFEFDIIIIEIHDYLFPKEYISENFFKLIYKKNENFRYECILQGENLIFFKR